MALGFIQIRPGSDIQEPLSDADCQVGCHGMARIVPKRTSPSLRSRTLRSKETRSTTLCLEHTACRTTAVNIQAPPTLIVASMALCVAGRVRRKVIQWRQVICDFLSRPPQTGHCPWQQSQSDTFLKEPPLKREWKASNCEFQAYIADAKSKAPRKDVDPQKS